MRSIGFSALRSLLIQSFAVFCLFLGLGLALLTMVIVWARARWPQPSPSRSSRKPPAS